MTIDFMLYTYAIIDALCSKFISTVTNSKLKIFVSCKVMNFTSITIYGEYMVRIDELLLYKNFFFVNEIIWYLW